MGSLNRTDAPLPGGCVGGDGTDRGDTLPHEIRGRNGILLRNTAAEVGGKWCTVGVGGLIPVVGPADSLIGRVALVVGRQRLYPIRDGNLAGGGLAVLSPDFELIDSSGLPPIGEVG